MKQNLVEFKGEIDISAMVFGELNVIFIDRIIRIW